MNKKALFLIVISTLFIVTACGDKEEAATGDGTDTAGGDYSTPAAGGAGDGGALPEGHPVMPPSGGGVGGFVSATGPSSHPTSATHKGVKVSDEVAAAWKGVKLGVKDGTAAAETLSIAVGKSVKLGESGFTLKVEAFLPDYAMYDDHIGSRSKDLNNPAVLVELFDGDKSVAKGWIFKSLPQFNSYKNERFSLELVEAEAA